MITCDNCGERFSEAGDGYDGLCPTCADRKFNEEEEEIEMTHTPGPLHVEAGRAICDEEGHIIASGQARRTLGIEGTDYDGIQPEDADAITRELAHRWNTQPALLEALEAMERLLRADKPYVADIAVAAIALAKGGEVLREDWGFSLPAER